MGLMTADHRRRLNKLGFQWKMDETRVETQDRHLEQMLARLRAYRKRYGHACVLRARDRALAVWIQQQRGYLTAGVLRECRRKAMDAAGFPWVPVDGRWEEKFAELRKFKARHGHTWVPTESKEHPALGSWASCQRQLFKAGKLPAERQRRLEELGFLWVITKDSPAERGGQCE
jgi:hypothetical protein